MRPFRRPPLVCQQAVELMSAYLDDELAARDRARLERHLADCVNCTEYLEQLRASITALGRVGHDELSDDAVNELVALYERWQHDD